MRLEMGLTIAHETWDMVRFGTKRGEPIYTLEMPFSEYKDAGKPQRITVMIELGEVATSPPLTGDLIEDGLTYP